MRKILGLVVLLSIAGGGATFAQNADQYLRDVTEGKWRANSPVNIQSLNDGERFAYISADGKSILINYYKSDKEEVLVDLDKIENCPVKLIYGFEFDESEKKILILANAKGIYRRSFIADYYIYNIKRNTMEPLSDNGYQQMAQFSPNGRIVAFARDNNMFLKKLDFGTESQITKDGKKNEIINGTPDWVYEEEFACIKYFDFSPDSKLIAYVKFEEKDVREFSFQIFDDLYPSSAVFKYPKAGTTNSKVSLWVYDIENRTTTKMKIEGEDFYIPYIKWSAENESIAVLKLSRDQKEIDILSVNPRSGVVTKLYGEKSDTYSDYPNFNIITFNPDNSFVIMSEKDGFRHIYLHSKNGLPKEQLTKGEFDVTNFYGYDYKTKTAYFQAAKNDPTQREVYKSVKGKIIPLSKEEGYQSATFSKNFKYAVHSFSNINTPNIYKIINNSGKTIRLLEQNKDLAKKFKEADFPQKQFFTFTTSEGVDLNGWIMEPKGVSKTDRVPIMLTQYSGPDSQEALNRWICDWNYYLAMEGFVVVCVDGRGTGARGTAFRNCTYGKLGVLEAKDQIETAKYIQGIYPNGNLSIWGWSYGGFMTLKCMTSDDSPFKAGIAIAPVTDWGLYNTAYTERFMDRPQVNFDGYEQSSVLNKAGNLKGDLLMIHGTADDNVHIQNTYFMAEELDKAGIIFDMRIFPNKNHSILGAQTRYNLFKQCADFLKDKLK